MSCSIHGDPAPHMYWEKKGKKIQTSEHHRTTHSHIRHILHIKKVTEEDFGTYFCVAKNPLGTARHPVELSGDYFVNNFKIPKITSKCFPDFLSCII